MRMQQFLLAIRMRLAQFVAHLGGRDAVATGHFLGAKLLHARGQKNGAALARQAFDGADQQGQHRAAHGDGFRAGRKIGLVLQG